jgi:formate hydrogenlyase subunit 4
MTLPPAPLLALGTLLVAAPALPGIAARTTALLTGRRGAPVLQPYRDMIRLLRKGAVLSETTTWVFRAAPAVVLATALLAVSLVPLDGRAAAYGFPGDLVAFVALLALGRLALVLGGLDTGSSFEGMGASRELAVSVFAEPALLAAFVTLALATGRLSLAGFLGPPLAGAWGHAAASIALVAASLFVVLLAEASRGPVDDPATHLELTMIHEVTILDYSGPDLAMLLYAGALRFALFAALVIAVLVPRARLEPAAAVAFLAASLAGLAVLVGIVESVMARLRLVHIPQFLVAAAALALLGGLLLLR